MQLYLLVIERYVGGVYDSLLKQRVLMDCTWHSFHDIER